MVTGRVLDHNPDEGTYSLPPEHAGWLTRAAGIDNLGLQAQCIPLIAEVEQQEVAAFGRVAVSRTRRTRGSTS